MKKWISLLLVVCLALTVTVMGAGAEPIVSVQIGDVDGDKSITAADALGVLKHVVGKSRLDSEHINAGDVTADQLVSSADALDILKLVVGKIEGFAAETQIPDSFASYKPYENSDFDYNTSLSVNGAYATDTTADCSFVMDNTGLAPKTIYQFSGSTITDWDVGRLVYSLQGLINRDFGRDANHTSILYATIDSSDTAWLDYMQEEGSVYAGYAVVKITGWDAFYTTFENQIKQCGLILWDGNVPATANVAATICGLDGYLPVLAKSPLHDQLVEKGVAVKQSLVGLFNNAQKGKKIADSNVVSTGSAKNDAYRWALDKYFDRCSANYLAYTLDGAVTVKGYEAYEDNPSALLKDSGKNSLRNHDYLIARRCFFFDLHPFDEEVCDDPAQQYVIRYTCPHCNVEGYYDYDAVSGEDDPICLYCDTLFVMDWGLIADETRLCTIAELGTDQETMLQIYAARYKRANGSMGQLMGFPPWWAKYTTHSEQGTKVATWIEWLYCELISCYNLAKEADAAGTVDMTNGSVFYKYVPRVAQYDNKFDEYDSGVTYDDDTMYFTIYMGDYDSSAWLKNYAFNFFVSRGGDKARAQLPLTWCFNPNLSLRIPMVFDYVYANKYEHEFITAGDSGAGYVIPISLFGDNTLSYAERTRPSNYTNGDQIWADYCKTFYDRFDMQATGFIINGNNAFTTDIARMFNTFSTRGSLHNRGDKLMTQYNGVPYIYCQNGIDQNTNMETLYGHAYERMAGYNFSAYRTVCVSPTNVKKIVDNFTDYATQKGHKIQYVELNTFLELAKQSGKGEILK